MAGALTHQLHELATWVTHPGHTTGTSKYLGDRQLPATASPALNFTVLCTAMDREEAAIKTEAGSLTLGLKSKRKYTRGATQGGTQLHVGPPRGRLSSMLGPLPGIRTKTLILSAVVTSNQRQGETETQESRGALQTALLVTMADEPKGSYENLAG